MPAVRLGALLAMTALACRESESVVVVSVSADAAVPPVRQIRLTLSNAGDSDVRLYPQGGSGATLSFPTSLVVLLPGPRAGTLDLMLDGLDGATTVVAHGDARVGLVQGKRSDVSVRLVARPSISPDGGSAEDAATRDATRDARPDGDFADTRSAPDLAADTVPCKAGYVDCDNNPANGCETPGACAPTAGLVAHYPFDGNADDRSGNGANGTPRGVSPTLDRTGRSGRAYHFDPANPSSIEMPSNSKLPVASSPRTMSVWMRGPAVTVPFQTVLNYGTTATGQRFGISTYMNPTGYAVFTGQDADVRTSKAVTDGNWHNVVVTFSGSAASVYVDAVLASSGSVSLSTAGTTLLVGAKTPNPDSREYFTGDLDDVRIYNRVLDDKEIEALFSEHTP